MTVPVTGGSRALGIRAAQALSPLPVVRCYLPRSATLVFKNAAKNAASGTQRNQPSNRRAAGWVAVALQAAAHRLVVRALGAQVIHARTIRRNAVRLMLALSRTMGAQEGARCGS